MVLNLHPFLAEVVECQRLTPREFVRQNEQFYSEWLCSPVGEQCKTVQSFFAVSGVSDIPIVVWMCSQE